MVRTRIAPSPTGYAHIGTIYQALFNFAYARKYGGQFIVRIEDTDRARKVEGAEDFIFNSLDWVHLSEDESPRKNGAFGPYRQSERLNEYHKYAEQLVREGHAYFSYFPKEGAGQKKDYTQGRSKEQVHSHEDPPVSISEMVKRGDWVVRMRVPKEETITVRDELRGDISFPSKEVTEQVLIKSDGFPTYHLAVVVDDRLMEISHIVRAEEWLSSLPKHVLLYKYLNWEMPPIYHTATLRNPDKSKLSKRHGHTNILWYKDEGFLPGAILNYLAHLGWTHPEEKEVFSLEEFIAAFELKDIRPVAAVFDVNKLKWMNQQHIQNLTSGELKKKLINYYKDNQDASRFLETFLFIDDIVALAKTRIETLKDFFPLIEYMLTPPDKSMLTEEHFKILPVVRDVLEKIDEDKWKKDAIFQSLKSIMTEHQGVKMPLFYVLFTGNKQGLPLPDMLELLGKKEVINRLHNHG